MSYSQTFNLQSLMSSSNGMQQDNTDYIRKHKVSGLIRKDVERMKELKSRATLAEQNEESFVELCRQECTYLFMNQPGIFYRVFKNELDLNLLDKILDTLQLIENGKLTQHEASLTIGQMIADLYTDSALKTSHNLDKKYASAESKPEIKIPAHSISWQEYKKVHLSDYAPKK